MNLFSRALKKSRESWFGKVTSLFDRQTIGEEVWTELEELLIAADVGMTTVDKLLAKVKQRVRDEKLKDGAQVRTALKEEMANLLVVKPSPATGAGAIPRVTLVVGVNGSGKTTSIAKLANRSRMAGRKTMLVAADTFRAAAIDQLKLWGDRAGVEVIAHQPGADPGAVVYDALAAAKSRGIQEVIIDTAGRLHTKFNLMEELKKIKRVAAKNDTTAPHDVILVMDATTGQNGLSQAKHFTEAVNVNSIFLAKLDGTAKGGIVLAICDELKIPVRYIGVGEKMDDIADFEPAAFVEALFSEQDTQA